MDIYSEVHFWLGMLCIFVNFWFSFTFKLQKVNPKTQPGTVIDSACPRWCRFLPPVVYRL